MKVDVLLGLQWGDEGKGKVVDVLTPNYDVVTRFQGGPNAGHTLEFNGEKYVLRSIPSGIFQGGKINVIGNGVVLDPLLFKQEAESLAASGHDITKQLYISKKAHLILPTTDIFSFGVMMYQLITGDLPFGRLDSERDLIQYLRKGKNGDWDRYLLLDTAEGRDWCKLIEGCLIPDFQNRLQDADEVLALVPQMQRVRPRIVEEQRDFQTRIINGVLLRIMQGEDYGKVYKLDDMLRGESAILSMGRKDDGVYNDIAIVEENSSYISRKH